MTGELKYHGSKQIVLTFVLLCQILTLCVTGLILAGQVTGCGGDLPIRAQMPVLLFSPRPLGDG